MKPKRFASHSSDMAREQAELARLAATRPSYIDEHSRRQLLDSGNGSLTDPKNRIGASLATRAGEQQKFYRVLNSGDSRKRLPGRPVRRATKQVLLLKQLGVCRSMAA